MSLMTPTVIDRENLLLPELPDVTLYEKVIFRKTNEGAVGTKSYITLERRKWVEACREYAQLPEVMKKFDYVTDFRLWHLSKRGKCIDIIKDYEWLKRKEPELFEQIFTLPFVMQLLYEISVYNGESDANKQKVIQWIAQNTSEKVTQKDFWDYIKKWQEFQGIKQNTIFDKRLELDFVKNWKKCFGLELSIDLNQKVQKKYIEELFEKMSVLVTLNGFGFGSTDIWQLSMDYKSNLMDLFSEFTGFQGNRMSYFQNLIEELLKEGDKEVIRKALEKNFISQEMVKKCMDLTWKAEKYELIPLLILKKYDGEWN